MTMIGDTVTALRGDAETAVKQVALTAAGRARADGQDSSRSRSDGEQRQAHLPATAQELVAKLNDGQGTHRQADQRRRRCTASCRT